MRKRELTPFGVVVKKRLIDVGMTQTELARQVGTSAKYLNLILYGERSGKMYVDKIIRVLHIDKESIEKIA